MAKAQPVNSTAALILLRHARKEEGQAQQQIALQHFCPNEPRIFRRLYDLGELPMRIVYSGRLRRVGWLVEDILSLDLQYYLPIFVSAFREPDEPLGFLALEASLDIIQVAGENGRVLTLGPLIGGKLKLALRSKAKEASKRALIFLEAFATCDAAHCGGCGVALYTLELKAIAAAVDAAKFQHPSHNDLATTILTQHLYPRLQQKGRGSSQATPRR